MNNVNEKALSKTINAVIKREAHTKKDISALSRDLLQYVVIDGGTNIQLINKLIAGVTPFNRQMLTLYFKTFLTYKHDDEAGLFTKKIQGDKAQEARTLATRTFLADEANDVWTWAEANIKPLEKAKPDYAKKITDDVAKALKHDVAQSEVIKAVLDGGVTIEAMLTILEVLSKEQPANVAQAA